VAVKISALMAGSGHGVRLGAGLRVGGRGASGGAAVVGGRGGGRRGRPIFFADPFREVKTGEEGGR